MHPSDIHTLYRSALDLLQRLIATPSISREEDATAQLIADFLQSHGVSPRRHLNNVWAVNRFFDPQKPCLLLNSHHDTVKPNQGYTRSPFEAAIEDGKLYGLGSNDAGGALCALLAVFVYFYEKENLPWNIVCAATAEEEISGANGIECMLPILPPITLGIVGEPTQMDMAISERGLVVLDCTAKGKSGHAAREEGINAIYEALSDIEWFRTFVFPRQSDMLGPVKMSVTMIQAGSQHNVVPDECRFTVDVRVNEHYSNAELVELIREQVRCEVKPRSLRLQSSRIPLEHPLVQAGLSIGMKTYGSPTSSDQALMPFTTIKIGPGDSARSHTADEYLHLKELETGIERYVKLLSLFFESQIDAQ